MATTHAFELLHEGVQKAIWAMGWKHLHGVQTEAIHTILQSDDHALICAPTAGGKTEAAFLPIISRIAEQPQPSVQAIYVGPLKALINDQFGRLSCLCQSLEIPVHPWHGDIPANQKKAFRDKPSGILLITPESLESNFINYGLHIPRIYRYLQFVVIDELHCFLGNVRGVHLRSLLHRLFVAIGHSPRLVGLSATLADPMDARSFLSPPEPSRVRIICDTSGGRTVKIGVQVYIKNQDQPGEPLGPRLNPIAAAHLAEKVVLASAQNSPNVATNVEPSLGVRSEPEVGDELDAIAQDLTQTCAESTNLVFVNSRALGEVLSDKLHRLAARLRWPDDPFATHHGSLSRALRSEAEERLRSGRATTAICSSTLELGIDVGSVRAVGQVDPPWSVSSLIQRLGRSGRKQGEPSILRMYIREDSPSAKSSLSDLLFPDLLQSIALIRLMVQKWLEPLEMDRLHLSTLIHQVLSCLKQSGGTKAEQLDRLLVTDGPFCRVGRERFVALLRSLGQHELIEQTPEGLLILAPLGERITGSYDFYSAFASSIEYAVRSASEEIGSLCADLIPPPGEHLILAGRRWMVQEILDESKLVLVCPARGVKTPIFRGAGGEIHSRIVQEMRAVLSDEDEPQYLSIDALALLRSGRKTAQASGVLQSETLMRPGEVEWFPWAGTRTLRALELFAKLAGIRARAERLSVTYQIESKDDFLDHLRFIAKSTLSPAVLAAEMAVKEFDKYDAYVPENLLDEANGADRLDVLAARSCALRVLSY